MNAEHGGQSVRAIGLSLYEEIRKDILFFGALGAVVGYLFPVHHKLESAGLAEGKAWADALAEDFLSIDAYAFVLFGLIAIGALASALSGFWREVSWLNAMRVHVEHRLAQIGSSIICFVSGMCAIAILHAVFTITPGGLLLLPATLLVIAFIVGSYIVGILIARRIEPFASRWAAVFMLSATACAIAWLSVQDHT